MAAVKPGPPKVKTLADLVIESAKRVGRKGEPLPSVGSALLDAALGMRRVV